MLDFCKLTVGAQGLAPLRQIWFKYMKTDVTKAFNDSVTYCTVVDGKYRASL